MMADRAATALDRMMVITPERVFYAGLLGRPRRRMSGGLNIYVAFEGSVSVATDAWTRREAAVVVPAYVPHCVASDHPAVICIVIEPETIADQTPAIIDAYLSEIGTAPFAAKVRGAACAFQAARSAMTSDSFDREIFDMPLPARAVDRRIRLAITALSDGGSSSLTAADCADRAKLSPSRFLHLFKDETGVSFRAFRAWKRARHMLHFVNEPLNLAHLAQDMGYPDSTHFSHSIRRFYGLKPRAIFSGSRDLAIFRPAAASP